MTNSLPPNRLTRTLAWVWLAVVLAVGGHTAWLYFGSHLSIDTDVLAMLPQNQRDPALQKVTDKLTNAASRRIVVLVGGQDWESAEKGGDAFATALARSQARISVRYHADNAQTATWLDFFTPYRAQLLTPATRQRLEHQSAQQLAEQALAALYQPMGMPRLGSWRDDPLNVYPSWLTAAAAKSPVRVTNGRLSLSKGEQHYALLMLEQRGSAYSMSEQQALMPILEQARQRAHAAHPGLEVLVVGVPLYAAAAAQQRLPDRHPAC